MNIINKQLIFIASFFISLMFGVLPVFACSPENPEGCSQSQMLQFVQTALSGARGDSYVSYPSSSGFYFTRNLALGSRGEEVRQLQKFLNSDPDTQVAYYGYGSPGMESTFFGYSTRNAVIRFQIKYSSDVLAPAGLFRGTGFWGSLSRNKANELLQGDIVFPEPYPEPQPEPEPQPNPNPNPQGVNGQCGYSNGQNFTYIPTSGLCSSGNQTSVTGSGPWYWSCQGYNGGSTASCFANYGQSSNNPSGVLSVNLAYDNPNSTTLVAGQGVAELVRYTFANNSSSEARITNVQLRRLGISSDSSLRNVYLFDGSTRLTDSASVSSGLITFNNYNYIFTIPANSTKTISVKADLGTNIYGQTIGVGLNYVNANVSVNGQFPINGNTFNIASGNLATVNISNVLPSSSLTTDPGNGIRIWEATLNINNKNVRFTRLSLKQTNSIESNNLTNFRLLIDGSEVAQSYYLDSNGYVTFTFDRTIYTGNRTVRVLADITGGSSRTVQMALISNADIDIKDSDYNVSVSPTGIPAIAGAISINVGQVTITPENSSLPSYVAKSGNNILVGKFRFRAVGEDIRVDTLKFGFNTNNASVNSLRNGRIMINGSQAGSTGAILKNGTVYYVNYTFPAGSDVMIEVYADTAEDTSAVSGDTTDNLASGDNFAIKMMTLVNNATRKTSYNIISVPTTEQVNSSLTISQGNITVTKKSNYGDRSTVLPQNAYKIGSWSVFAGSAEGININNLNFVISPVTGTSFTNTDLSDMYASYSIDNGQSGNTSVKNTVNASSDYSTSFTLDANKTMTIDLYANLSGNVTTGDSMRAALVISGNGSQSGNSITTASVNGQIISNNNPSLLVSRDPSTPSAGIVDDSGSVKTVSYRFESENDTYTISQLSFDIVDPSVVSTVRLKYGYTTLQERPAASSVVFSGFGNIEVPANSYKILDVELVMSGVGAGAGNSGADVMTSIDIADCIVRSSSGASVVPGGTPSAGNHIYVYKAYPSLGVVSQNTGNNEDRLTAGDNAILKFNVVPNGGVIAWKKMSIAVTKTATNIIADGIRLVDSSSGQTIATLAAGDSDCEDNTLTTCTINIVLPIEEQLSSSKNYEIRGTVSGTLATNSYITAQLSSSQLAYAAPTTYAAVSSTNSRFVWSDISAQGHSVTTSDWNNDNYIKTFPISWTRTVK